MIFFQVVYEDGDREDLSFSQIRSLLTTRSVSKVKQNNCVQQSKEPDDSDAESATDSAANEETTYGPTPINTDSCPRTKFTRDPYKRARQNRSLAPMNRHHIRPPLVRDDRRRDEHPPGSLRGAAGVRPTHPALIAALRGSYAESSLIVCVPCSPKLCMGRPKAWPMVRNSSPNQRSFKTM